METATKEPILVLASKSPRRKHLLEKAGLKFIVVPSEIQEEKYPVSDPKTYVKRLAKAKAEYVAHQYPDKWIIGADSIVVLNDKVFEKPASAADARKMLNELSGKTHYVHTGFAIICKNRSHAFSEVITTAVMFKTLTEKEIEWYVSTTEPYDKAGGYAIQGLASSMVKQINGSYTNVVGLPVCEVVDYLFKHNVIKRNLNPH